MFGRHVDIHVHIGSTCLHTVSSLHRPGCSLNGSARCKVALRSQEERQAPPRLRPGLHEGTVIPHKGLWCRGHAAVPRPCVSQPRAPRIAFPSGPRLHSVPPRDSRRSGGTGPEAAAGAAGVRLLCDGSCHVHAWVHGCVAAADPTMLTLPCTPYTAGVGSTPEPGHREQR